MLRRQSRRRDLLILAAVHFALFVVLFKPWGGGGCDGTHYYTYLSSFLFDGDLDTANDFSLSPNGIYTIHEQISRIGPNGFSVNIFPMGNSVLWFPFVFPVRIVGWISGWSINPPPAWAASRYSAPYCMAVSFAGVCYGYLALALMYLTCRMQFRRIPSLAAALGAMFASPALFYTFQSAEMSHVGSAFAVALLLYLSFRHRKYSDIRSYGVIAIALALATLVRWQDVIFALVPFAFWLRTMRNSGWAGSLRAVIVRLLPAALVFAAIIFLQMCYWYIRYGTFLTVPQGGNYMQWTNPAMFQVLFSGWHGLFYCHPLLLLGAAGIFAALLRTRGSLIPVLVALSAMIAAYVNACPFDWYGNASFGSRRFCSALPFLAVGLGSAWSVMRGRWKCVPLVATAVAVFANIMLVAAYSRRMFDTWFLSELWALRTDLPRLLAHWIPTIPLESQPVAEMLYPGHFAGPTAQLAAGFVLIVSMAFLSRSAIFRLLETRPVIVAVFVIFGVLNILVLVRGPGRDVLGQEFTHVVNSSMSDDEKKSAVRELIDKGFRHPEAVFYRNNVLKDRSELERDLAILSGTSPALCAKWVQTLPKEVRESADLERAGCVLKGDGGSLYLPTFMSGKGYQRRQEGDRDGEKKWYHALWCYNPFDGGAVRRLAEIAEESGDAETATTYRSFRRLVLTAKVDSFFHNVRHVRSRSQELKRDWRNRLFQVWYREAAYELAETWLKKGENAKVFALYDRVERYAVLDPASRELKTKAEAALQEKKQ